MKSKIGNSSTVKEKPCRPPLPVRPPSLKKSHAVQMSETTKEFLTNAKGTGILNVEGKQVSDLSSVNDNGCNDASQISKPLQCELLEINDNFDASYPLASKSEMEESEFKKLPSLSRTMSGPVSSQDKESLEKKRSISMRTDQQTKADSTNPMLQSRPMPKPRKLTQKNSPLKPGRPVPVPRAKKMPLIPNLNAKSSTKKNGENLKNVILETSLKEPSRDAMEDVAEEHIGVKDISEMEKSSQRIEEQNNNLGKVFQDSTIKSEKEIDSLERKCDKDGELDTDMEIISQESSLRSKEDVNELENNSEDKISKAETPSKEFQSAGLERNNLTKREVVHPYENVVVTPEKVSVSREKFTPVKQVGNRYENVPDPVTFKSNAENTDQLTNDIAKSKGKEQTNSGSIPDSNLNYAEGNMEIFALPSNTNNPSSKTEELLDFKHLRIDTDGNEDDDNLYAMPKKELLMQQHEDSNLACFLASGTEGSSESYYQCPTSTPGLSSWENSPNNDNKSEKGSPDMSSKPLRRPPPHPPHLDSNVLRSRMGKPNTEQVHLVPKSTRKHLSFEECNIREPLHENIYVVPKIEDDKETVERNKEASGNSRLSALSSGDNDDDDDDEPVYKEPSTNNNIMSSHVELLDPHLQSVHLHSEEESDNEYVDPSCLARHSYAETGSSGSTRSSVALNACEESEYSNISNQLELSPQKVQRIDHGKNTIAFYICYYTGQESLTIKCSTLEFFICVFSRTV